jgi:ABC-type lipoprotein export system ATPase subunit
VTILRNVSGGGLPRHVEIEAGSACGCLFISGLTSLVQARDVRHAFGEGDLRKEVLHGISCEIHSREIVIITGPSGSGKTTFLTLIGALRELQTGSVSLLGRELRGAKPEVLVEARRAIGFARSCDRARNRGSSATTGREEDCALILITHDQRILSIADRLLHLEDGLLSGGSLETESAE